MTNRTLRYLLFAAVACFLASTPLRADVITFKTDTTLGCFSATANCSLTTNFASPVQMQGSNPDLGFLQFTGINMGSTGTSAAGNLDIKLGSFLLDNGGTGSTHDTSYLTGDFLGMITFLLPPGVTGGNNGGNSEIYTALVSGTIYKNNNPGSNTSTATLDFVNTPINFGFAGGQFSFYVDDVTITIDQNGNKQASVDWYGHVTGARFADPVPEPGSLSLLSGCVLLGWAALRRRH